MTTAKATWSVVVVYDNPVTREAAVSFCDQLVQRFWQDLEFDVSWWPAKQLQEANAARDAGRRAAQAELVIFALPSPDQIPLEVQAWVETWLCLRGDREGAIVGLLPEEQRAVLRSAEADQCLRQLAHRAGMDYLTQVPPSVASQIPESVESCVARAQQVTSVLDEILHQQPPRPRPFR